MKTAYSTRANGSMKTATGTVDLHNILAFLKSEHLSSNAVCMGQVHGGTVSVIADSNEQIIPEVDALVSNNKDLTLCVVTADCLPILLFDPNEQAIGAVHAGSKGLLRDIIHNTVDTLKQKYGSRPENISVMIGPSIEKKCYEVGTELVEQFEKVFPWFKRVDYTTKAADKYLLDLRAISQQCLIKEGILTENIQISDHCTKCNNEIFYSYRGGDKTGRFVSAITLV